MADIFRIPLSAELASFKIRVEIEGSTFILRFHFNERMNRWTMGIYDALEEAILVGVVLNINSSILGQYADPRLPPGEMILYDTSEQNLEAGRNDLGDRAVLIYQEAE